MKIGVDLRFIRKDRLYSVFVLNIINELEKLGNYNISVYINDENDLNLFGNNIDVKFVKEKPGNFLENFTLNSAFKKENFDLMIFFNEYKPITYKGKYIILLPSLFRLLFGEFSSTPKKHYYLKLLGNNLKNAEKIICFDEKTQEHINERFNINENKIQIFDGFFPLESIELDNHLDINIKEKYQIDGEYIIYDSEEINLKNMEKVFSSMQKMKKQKIKLNLFIIGENNSIDLEFRKLVLDYDLNNLVFFIGDLDPKELEAYYSQSNGLLYSDLYATFPFDLNTALVYNLPILSNNLDSVKKIFGDKINYFNVLSSSETYDKLLKFSQNKNEKVNYSDLFKVNNSKIYCEKLDELIENTLLTGV